MSMRTFDPKEPEAYPQAHCSEDRCWNPYHTICRLCNLAFCLGHLKNYPHKCDTGMQFLVLTEDEVLDLFAVPPHVHVFSERMEVKDPLNPKFPGVVERCECGIMRLGAPNGQPAHVHVFDLRLTVGNWPNRGYVEACACGVLQGGAGSVQDGQANPGATP